MADAKLSPAPKGATGILVLADGSTIWGRGFGAEGEAVGEVCFNTAMTGYQEVMTDPSYAAQIINFTFPHIGNVGANYEDLEADNPHALGCVVQPHDAVLLHQRADEPEDRALVHPRAQGDLVEAQRGIARTERVEDGKRPFHSSNAAGLVGRQARFLFCF